MKLLAIAMACVVLSGCTDAEWDRNIGKLGVAADIKCYSGGQIVFEDTSTGAVANSRESDGWVYRSAVNNKTREVSADCIITYRD